MTTTLIVPGLGNSGPDHWQSWWQAQEPGAVRVGQADWDTPDLPRWSANVLQHLQQATAPVWIVAHSFGCLAAVLAAAQQPEAVAGAFLVAPADPGHFDGVESLLPTKPLAFPSLLLASSNDPWLKLMVAALWAQRWGSRLVSLGAAGHINAAAGFGPWAEGRELFAAFNRSRRDWLYGEIDGEINQPLDSFQRGHHELGNQLLQPLV